MQHETKPTHDTITLLWECRQTCQTAMFHHCIEMGGKHIEAAHLRLMTDCMQACQTAADFMVRNSALYAAECAATAEVCDACATSCENISDAAMMHCAEICRRCADACREMSHMKRAA